MAEAIGVVASIASLIQLTGAVTRICHGYIGAVKGAPKDIQTLTDGLTELEKVLKTLDSLNKSNTLQSDLQDSLKQCTLELEDLKAKVTVKSTDWWRKRAKRLYWPLQQAETSKILGQLERHKSLFTLALAVDQQLLLQTVEIYTQRTDLGVGELQQRVRDIQKKLEVQNVTRVGGMRADALEWLFPDSFDEKHREIYGKRQKDTGTWLPKTPEFIEWTKGYPSCRLLWGYGIPGAGKTYLSSFVIDYLEAQAAGANYGVAYIYFNSKEQNRQKPTHVLASLTKQLAAQKSQLPKEIEVLYNEQKGIKKPTIDELQIALLGTSKLFDRVFFVFDAVDECDPDSLDEFLRLFHRLGKDGASVFLTGRRYYRAIEKSFCNIPKVEIAASDEDIKIYVGERMKNNDLFQDGDVGDTITSELVKCSHGMFLLVRLYLEDICQYVTVNQVRTALDKLRSTGSLSQEKALEGVYGRIIEKIMIGHHSRRTLAIKILSWLVKAKVTLTVDQLRVAVSVQENQHELQDADLPQRETLLEVCAGLVTISETSNTIQLAHLSVQEYLVEKRVIPDHANFELAMVCTTFLTFNIFASNTPTSADSAESYLELHPFLKYAVPQLSFHLQACDENLSVDMVLRFLGNEGCISSYQRILEILDWDKPGITGSGRLHTASFLGHVATIRRLLNEKVPLDSWGGFEESTPLHLAGQEGHKDVVQLLLENDADPTVEDLFGRAALHLAAQNGHEAVAKLLLEKGVDPNFQDNSGETALHLAAENGYEAVVKLLLEMGVNPTVEDLFGRAALHPAARNGHEAVVKLLLERGADPNVQDQYKLTALHVAARNDHEAVVKLLLEKGVDLNFQDNGGETALHLATDNGHEAVVKLLLEMGVDSTVQDLFGRAALHLAAKNGHEAVVKLLLEKGADPNAQNRGGMTASSIAKSKGYHEIANLLEIALHERKNNLS